MTAAGRVLDRVHDAALAEGLAAGLRTVLAEGVAVPCSAGGYTLVPATALDEVAAWRLAGTELPADRVEVAVRSHPLAGTEGLRLVRVRPLDKGCAAAESAGPDSDLLLAAVRLGLGTRMLRLGVRHLANRYVEDRPLTHKQLVQGAIAEASAALELCRAALTGPTGGPAVRALHERLRATGWSITTWFGGNGYLRDHPVRCLYVAELVHDAWVAPPAERATEA